MEVQLSTGTHVSEAETEVPDLTFPDEKQRVNSFSGMILRHKRARPAIPPGSFDRWMADDDLFTVS